MCKKEWGAPGKRKISGEWFKHQHVKAEKSKSINSDQRKKGTDTITRTSRIGIRKSREKGTKPQAASLERLITLKTH